jgi:hypothetical protein
MVGVKVPRCGELSAINGPPYKLLQPTGTKSVPAAELERYAHSNAQATSPKRRTEMRRLKEKSSAFVFTTVRFSRNRANFAV